jgi:hypothetical protein
LPFLNIRLPVLRRKPLPYLSLRADLRQRGRIPSAAGTRAVRLLCCLFLVGLAGYRASAQTVEPVIVEYQGKASGKFALVNRTLTPMAVVLEPRSFSITPSGNGVFRALDPGIHLELSAMSVRLEPGQTYYVFYKARADKLPAWFTIYAVFSSLHPSPGLDIRILLPHTVYLYQKQRLDRHDIQLTQATYSAATKKIVCDLQNVSSDLGRVQQIRVTGGHGSTTAAGFPLLPGDSRHVEVTWDGVEPPRELQVEFKHFTLEQSLEPPPAPGDK